MMNTFITNVNTSISLQLLQILRILQTFEYHLIYEQFAMKFAEIQSIIFKSTRICTLYNVHPRGKLTSDNWFLILKCAFWEKILTSSTSSNNML